MLHTFRACFFCVLMLVACSVPPIQEAPPNEILPPTENLGKFSTLKMPHYTILVRNDWDIDQSHAGSLRLTAQKAGADGFRENLSVDVYRENFAYIIDTIVFRSRRNTIDSIKINHSIDIDQFAEQYIEKNYSHFNHLKIGEMGQIKHDKEVAKFYVHVYSNIAAYQGSLKSLTYFIPNGTAEVVVITGTEAAENFVAARKIFEHIIQSFHPK